MCSWLERRAILSAGALTSCSTFLAGEVRRKMRVEAPVEVIPNGIDVDLFDSERPVDVRALYGIPAGKPIIFFAGRMERRKGIHLCGAIASAILREFDAAFVFAGQDLFGYMKDVLLPSLAGQELKGSVHYLGKLDLPEVRSFVKGCDIFLLPSLWENMPYSCLEAMAAGRAIVASAQGGVPELITHGSNGLLANAGDPESFVHEIRYLLGDPALRMRFGQAARSTVQQSFTDERVARLSADFYSMVVKQWRAGKGQS